MKKITAISLVMLLSVQCLYKLGVITYFQLNRDYIADVLCVNKEKPITMCYGQCFLDKNLSLAGSPSENAATSSSKQQVEFPVFLISEIAYSLSVETFSPGSNSHYNKGLSSKHSSVPFHPPALHA